MGKKCQDREEDKWRWGRGLKRKEREEEGRKRERGEEGGGDHVSALPDNRILHKTLQKILNHWLRQVK